MDPKFLEQAKAEGYSDEEIQQFIGSQSTAETISEPVENSARQISTEPAQQSEAITQPQASPEGDSFAHRAIGAGYSTDEVETLLADKAREAGNTNDDLKKEIIRQGQERGMSDEQIMKILQDRDELGYEKPKTALEKAEINAATAETTAEQIENANDLATAYSNIHSRWGTIGKMVQGWAGNEEKMTEALKDVATLNNGLVNTLREKGVSAYIDPDSSELMMTAEDGSEQIITPDIWDELVASKFETGGAIAGALYGTAKGGAAGASYGATFGPYGAAAGGVIGGGVGMVTGGYAGAAAGSGLDYVNNSYQLKQDLDAEIALAKMHDAGVADVTMTIIAGAAWKTAKPIAKTTIKYANNAFRLAKNGNVDGAYDILLKDMNLTTAQADDAIAAWKQLSGATTKDDLPKHITPAGKERALTDKELAIKIITETRPGGENIIKATEGSSMPIVNSIDTRAKNLTAVVNKLSPGEAGKEVRQALTAYRTEVGQLFDQTKKLASDVIDRTDYRFDINNTAVQPALKEARKYIEDPMQVQRFDILMERVDGMADTRTFSDLLDLRQLVGAQKSRAKNHGAQQSLKKSINNIDREIQRVTDEYLPAEQAKVWRKQFKTAKAEYSKMKKLEENVLYKTIVNKKGITEDQILKKLTDMAPALDETFYDVMQKLPKGLKDKTEGAVLKMLTSKYTVGGSKDSLQAVAFPELAEKLSKYQFSSPAAKQYVKMVDEFANVFRNDIHLGRTVGNLHVPRFQSYLTTDPIARAKYEFASSIFNGVKRLVPSAAGNRLALVKSVGNMLDDPLNAKQMYGFIRKFPSAQQDEVKSMVESLQREWVKAGLNTKEGKEQLKLYRAYKKGHFGESKKSHGKLGTGYYYKSALDNPKETRNIVRHDAKPGELASPEDINRVVGRELDPASYTKYKSLNKKLKAEGYKGILKDGQAMLFEVPE